MRLVACACAVLGVLVPALLVGPFDAVIPALLIALPASACLSGLAGRLGRHGVVRGGKPSTRRPRTTGTISPSGTGPPVLTGMGFEWKPY